MPSELSAPAISLQTIRATAEINPSTPHIRPIPPDQKVFEREIIWTMHSALQSVRDAGYKDWQTVQLEAAALPRQSWILCSLR
jgi:hypothetical protein